MISDKEIKNFTDSIVQFFNPEKIILFGSYAYGTPNENSDVDLLIIMPFEGKSSRKSLEIWSKIKPAFSCDLIVKTPEDTLKRYRLGDPLIGEAVDKGRVLYERYN
jgi:uncharacterized protein